MKVLEAAVKSFITALGVAFFSLFALAGMFRRTTVPEESLTFAAKEQDERPRPAVVVELFTSEGCSSCPPADALLAQLVSDQRIAGAEVIALEEHVDYWNHLGWIDPFSSQEFTFRQQEYEEKFRTGSVYTPEKFRTGSVYTPQMVVDGSVEFVGSHEGQARHVITQAAQTTKTPVHLTFAAGSGSRASLQVTVGKLSGATPDDRVEVFLAVTETGLHSDVRAGENAGHDVGHSAVVRALRKLGQADPRADIGLSAAPELKLQAKWKRENLRAVVFLQERKSRRIIGAASLPLT